MRIDVLFQESNNEYTYPNVEGFREELGWLSLFHKDSITSKINLSKVRAWRIFPEIKNEQATTDE